MPKKIVAFKASPRPGANSTLLLQSFLDGVRESGEDEHEISVIDTGEADILPCRGCLRCNVLKRCIVRKDDWQDLSARIIESDILVFATPIYFHHTTSSCKRILDRFRSFVKVRITEDGLEEAPHQEWNKNMVLLSAHGSSSADDARPLIELFSFMRRILGEGNTFQAITATRLAMAGQIAFPVDKLESLYEKLGLPQHLAREDVIRNRGLLDEAFSLGKQLGAGEYSMWDIGETHEI